MSFRDYTEIIFAGGEILSAQMLEETYRYPREFLHIYHAAASDGIVAGLDFQVEHGDVHLTPGIVKMDGKYYILPESVPMDAWIRQRQTPLQPSVEYFLCLVAEDVRTSEEAVGGISSRSRLTLQAERAKSDHALLLGKYKYRPDVKISLPKLKPESKEPFAEFAQASFLQLLDCEYAHRQGGTTYHPLIFRAIQSYLEQKAVLSPYDFSLLQEVQNHGIVAVSTLQAYVAASRKVSAASLQMTRENLFKALAQCVQESYSPVAYPAPPPAEEQVVRAKRQSKLI